MYRLVEVGDVCAYVSGVVRRVVWRVRAVGAVRCVRETAVWCFEPVGSRIKILFTLEIPKDSENTLSAVLKIC